MFMSFLIFLLIIYLLYKALPWLLAWWVQRQHRKFEQQAGEAYERAAREHRAEQCTHERTTHIEDNAEDAEYQELTGPREVVVEETFTVEEQVTDAEFEDI